MGSELMWLMYVSVDSELLKFEENKKRNRGEIADKEIKAIEKKNNIGIISEVV